MKFGDVTYRGRVIADWLDQNGHMNLGYYLILFDHGTAGLFRTLAVGELSRELHNQSMFTIETHVTYQKELLLGDEFYIESRIAGYDHNKLHYIHWMIETETGELCATNELLSLNVDMTARRSTNFPAETLDRMAAMRQEQATYGPLCGEIGRRVRQIGFPPLLSGERTER